MNSARIPAPINEPVLSYAPGSRERGELKQAIKDLSGRQIEIPIVIGGKEIRTGKTVDAVMPHCHRHVLAKVHQAGPEEVNAAVGQISLSSPLGRALLNRVVGDEVEVQTPRGKRSYQITELVTLHEKG